ncbi:hypothetical protein [Azospirillum sp. TSO35-2]|uniref:hypothetical protein n=1 Tax=Azospirillum sp. TSO35-2 TaxID=716796 RepID=UPI000D6187D2|nr:hypothetical protein [Azospirillum sp. TSO35-2]PWC36215.1 hypothetical protein TSO352_13875 [Azospirillum sp. TSO35-2]
MRSPFRSLLSALIPAVLAAALVAAPALAEDHGKSAPKAAASDKPGAKAAAKPGAPSGKATMMIGSPLAKVKFSEPAYPLTDDGTYRGFMGKILDEYDRRCVRQEQFGWEIAKDDQERLDYVFQGTMENFGRAGYLLGEVHPKAVTDPETIAFLADLDKRRLLLVWTPLESSVLFMMCETAAKDAKEEGKDAPKAGPRK